MPFCAVPPVPQGTGAAGENVSVFTFITKGRKGAPTAMRNTEIAAFGGSSFRNEIGAD
jgi:hypothetical protein